MNCKQTLTSVAIVTAILASLGATKLVAQPFDISWYTFDSGGGYCSDASFELESTIGQHDAGTPMSAGNFTLTGGFLTDSTTGEIVVAVDTLNVVLGTLTSGSVTQIQDSDNQYAVLSPDFEASRYQLIFTLDGTSSTQTPSNLDFNLESKTFSFVGVVDQRIELYNYTTGQFETIDSRNTTSSDSVTTVTPNGDPSRFVESGSGAIQARIRYQNTFPYWIFSVENAYLPFRTSVDHAFWTITQ